MDILDILLDILLKPPQPFMGLFLMIPGPFEYFSEIGALRKSVFPMKEQSLPPYQSSFRRAGP